MPNFSTGHMGYWDSLQILISGLFRYGYPSNISCNKACNICKIKRMVIKLIPLGYLKSLPRNFFESICRNIENNKEKNPQIDHVEETVGVKWFVSNVLSITTCDYQSVSIAGVF